MSTNKTPVIFIHGLWIHSSAWQPWLDLFATHGYRLSAPGWPGDAPTVADTRANADALNDVGIAQIVDHYADLIGTPERKPMVIGHSFGGLIAQELLASGHAAAAVAIDPPRSRASKRCRSRSCGRRSRCWATRRTGTGRLVERQAVPLRLRQHALRRGVRRPARQMDHPGPGGRCSRTPRPTSHSIRLPRSTPSWPTVARCC